MSGSGVKVSAVIRFYQIEWLCALSSGPMAPAFGEQKDIPVLNPTISAISENKRFPLLFRDAKTSPLERPRARVPRPREISAEWDTWVPEASYSNTGDRVLIVGDLTRKQREQAIRRAQHNPFEWVAQRRFATLALETRRGPVFPCVGVFVVGGRAAGAYVRRSSLQLPRRRSRERRFSSIGMGAHDERNHLRHLAPGQFSLEPMGQAGRFSLPPARGSDCANYLIETGRSR